MSDDNRTPEEIQAEIEQTRSEMSKTVDEIQERLAPENLKAQAKEKVQETVHNAKEQAREKVISAKNTVVGRVEERVHDIDEKVSDVSAKVTEWVQNNPLSATAIGLGVGVGLFLLARWNRSSSRSAQFRNVRDNYYPTRRSYYGPRVRGELWR